MKAQVKLEQSRVVPEMRRVLQPSDFLGSKVPPLEQGMRAEHLECLSKVNLARQPEAEHLVDDETLVVAGADGDCDEPVTAAIAVL